jgi:hypothetical protein
MMWPIEAAAASGRPDPAGHVKRRRWMVTERGSASGKAARYPPYRDFSVGVADLAGMAVSRAVTLRGPMGWLCIRLPAADGGLA